jgi:pimeloyl-ACP methyl ester carboxylesterase
MGEELDVTVGSHRLHCKRFGSRSAPLVVGLPGLSGDVSNFAYLGEQIGGDSLQLVALAWRGRGRSETTAPGTYGWESHARDVLGLADALGFEAFAVVGQSMGGSVAMKVAEVDGKRLAAVVLIDVAGRVDRGVGPVVEATIRRLPAVVTSSGAVAEDRAYTQTQHPYERWKHLTMPTLLVRATREFEPGSGYVVPADDRDRFRREVPDASVVEVDANHQTINTHPDTADAVRAFLSAAL